MNLLLIPQYNILGAAVATTISFVFLNIISTAQLYRAVGVQPISKATLRLAVIGGVLAFSSVEVVSLLVTRPWFVVLGFGLLFGPLYLLSIVVTGGVSENELLLVDRLEDSVGVDLKRLKAAIRWAENQGI